MCLAVPGRILEVKGQMATVDVAGVRGQVCIDLVEDAKEGEYVLVHVGFALQKLDQARALETLELLGQVFGSQAAEEAVGRGGDLP